MTRQIDPWHGAPQPAVLEEYMHSLQVRVRGLEGRVLGLEEALGRLDGQTREIGPALAEVRAWARELEGQLSEVTAALSMLADDLARENADRCSGSRTAAAPGIPGAARVTAAR